MRRPADFKRAVGRGARCGAESLVVHLAGDTAGRSRPLVGFVVSKAVGNAVTRTRVKRRLRAVVSGRIDQVPAGGLLVVRALPSSAGRDSAVLEQQFDVALAGARSRFARQRSR